MWRTASKSSCKTILESVIIGKARLSVEQLRGVLDLICMTKDGEVSQHTLKTLKPLYQALDRNELPSKKDMLLAWTALSKQTFFRKKKKAEPMPEPEAIEEETLEQPEAKPVPKVIASVKVPLV